MATTNSILIEALTQIAGSNDSERIAEIARLAAQRILSSDAIALAQASGDVFWSHDPGQQKHTAQFRGTERLSLIGGPSKGSGEEWGYAGGAIAAPSAGHSGSSGHFQTEYPTPLMVEINAAKAWREQGPLLLSVALTCRSFSKITPGSNSSAMTCATDSKMHIRPLLVLPPSHCRKNIPQTLHNVCGPSSRSMNCWIRDVRGAVPCIWETW